MALLGLAELSLTAGVILILLVPSDVISHLLLVPATAWGGELALAALIALTICVVAATIGLYRPRICHDPRRLLVTATLTGMVASPIILLLSGPPDGEHVIWVGKALGAWLIVLAVTRLAYVALSRHGRFSRQVLVIGAGERAAKIRELLHRHHGRRFEPILVEPGHAVLAAERPRPARLWGVVVAGGALTAETAAALLDGKCRGIKVFSEAAFHEQHFGRIDLATMENDGAGAERWLAARTVADGARRVFDVIVSAALLTATLPLMLVVAALIKLDSPGPAFYRQQRSGLLGRPFMLLKFRSMRADAEACGTPRWAQRRDPRATRVGRFIRQTRIDELPQLLNVLRGDMSMIGPRPERPHFVEELVRAIPCYNVRANVKPGITGWAQVNYPYGASVEDAREKLAYDLYYVKNRGILLDILILCATVRVILFREGAR